MPILFRRNLLILTCILIVLLFSALPSSSSYSVPSSYSFSPLHPQCVAELSEIFVNNSVDVAHFEFEALTAVNDFDPILLRPSPQVAQLVEVETPDGRDISYVDDGQDLADQEYLAEHDEEYDPQADDLEHYLMDDEDDDEDLLGDEDYDYEDFLVDEDYDYEVEEDEDLHLSEGEFLPEDDDQDDDVVVQSEDNNMFHIRRGKFVGDTDTADGDIDYFEYGGDVYEEDGADEAEDDVGSIDGTGPDDAELVSGKASSLVYDFIVNNTADSLAEEY